MAFTMVPNIWFEGNTLPEKETLRVCCLLSAVCCLLSAVCCPILDVIVDRVNVGRVINPPSQPNRNEIVSKPLTTLIGSHCLLKQR